VWLKEFTEFSFTKNYNMDRKTWTIILALALIGCFFLPWIKFPNGSPSAFDVVTNLEGNKDAWPFYLWLLIPLSGIMLLIGALNRGTYFLGRGFWAFLPLLVSIFIPLWAYFQTDNSGADSPIGDLLKQFDYGYWATLGLSLLLAFVNPRPR
jgi:hypothetical protein